MTYIKILYFCSLVGHKSCVVWLVISVKVDFNIWVENEQYVILPLFSYLSHTQFKAF